MLLLNLQTYWKQAFEMHIQIMFSLLKEYYAYRLKTGGVYLFRTRRLEAK